MTRIVPSVPHAVRRQKIDRRAPSARHYKDSNTKKGNSRVAKYIQDDAVEDNRPEVDQIAKIQRLMIGAKTDTAKIQQLTKVLTSATRKDLALNQARGIAAKIELKNDIAFLQRAVSYYPFKYYKALEMRDRKEDYSYPDFQAARRYRAVHAPVFEVTETTEYREIMQMNMHELRVLFEHILRSEFGLEKALYNRWKLILFALALKLRDDANRPASVEKIIPDAPETTKRFVVEHMRDADTYYISNATGSDESDDDSGSDGIDQMNIVSRKRKRGIRQTSARINALEKLRNAKRTKKH